MRIRVSDQVVDFVRRLAPEPRRRVREALRALGQGSEDIKALEAPVDGYWRLRIGNFRVLFVHATPGRIDCVFIERRALLYEVFAAEVADRLRGKGERD
jgi:mRNA interferase RelE/StbE